MTLPPDAMLALDQLRDQLRDFAVLAAWRLKAGSDAGVLVCALGDGLVDSPMPREVATALLAVAIVQLAQNELEKVSDT